MIQGEHFLVWSVECGVIVVKKQFVSKIRLSPTVLEYIEQYLTFTVCRGDQWSPLN